MVDTYKACLVKLMSHANEQEYDKDYNFSLDELATLTPIHVARWMKLRAYGMEEPGPNDQPTFARSGSLEFWKKAISSFMPNRLMAWNAIASAGNPTRSIEVNDLIKAIRKKEVRK